MEFRQLGQTDINVSSLCLGTMAWGEQNTEQDAFQQLECAIDYGINFIDTAEMYPVPAREETYTATETILGNWLKKRGHHDDLVIATKVCGPGFDYMNGGRLMTPQHIHHAVEGSLKRLGVDCIDLFQLHWPDRNTNFFGRLGYSLQPGLDGTPVEITLEALNDLVQAGKIRHYGLSNETPWGAMKHLSTSREKQQTRPVSIQNPYSLLNRSFEVGLAEISHREQLGLLAYSPLAFGTLSGKYLNDQKPANSRLALFEQYQRYTSSPQSLLATEAYVNLAKESGLDPAQMALAFVTSRFFVSSAIIGATNLEQLNSNLRSSELTLSNDVLEAIEEIHLQYPNPAP
ncbi:aldo/keto reductase [Endozoicomonas montiporae]|uniref:Protein tas n=2 Tax=Endozoicomonas montiporae TaxID=1027273 RepID=A0A081N7I7_9GAMM|nr:aldo/keto reductase [Endozoicomonas montiporae]AMO55749.1 NADP-dependent oxidoreductase domain-containing protein [Endozoicomonas montiporae CL-33]KEQ14410.1 aldo/keto reductase [Endozoicomonas montiporae]